MYITEKIFFKKTCFIWNYIIFGTFISIFFYGFLVKNRWKGHFQRRKFLRLIKSKYQLIIIFLSQTIFKKLFFEGLLKFLIFSILIFILKFLFCREMNNGFCNFAEMMEIIFSLHFHLIQKCFSQYKHNLGIQYCLHTCYNRFTSKSLLW